MNEIVLAAVIVIALVVILTLALLVTRTRLIPAEKIVISVNGAMSLEAQRGERLLGVLHRSGIGIPAACGGSGTCGLCRVHVEGEGAGEPQATERGVLSAAEYNARAFW